MINAKQKSNMQTKLEKNRESLLQKFKFAAAFKESNDQVACGQFEVQYIKLQGFASETCNIWTRSLVFQVARVLVRNQEPCVWLTRRTDGSLVTHESEVETNQNKRHW